ncbi:MAG: ferritin-like protein [Armatimonas sp.]
MGKSMRTSKSKDDESDDSPVVDETEANNKEQIARAARLRQQITRIVTAEPQESNAKRPPESPREFTHRRMREEEIAEIASSSELEGDHDAAYEVPRKEGSMKDSQKIVTLMQTSESVRDLDWLKESLQAAIELEFSTIPPYLAAEWSIKDSSRVADSIHEVVREEMLHFGLMCNLLTAIGGQPRLNEMDVVPRYPSELPGGVQPGLVVPLQRLTTESAKLFMQIEFPEGGPIALTALATFTSIGEFYDAIQQAFDTLNPTLSSDRQLKGPLGLSRLTTPDEVRAAIDLIKHQGEGSDDSPEEKPGDLAHYYRFKEIVEEKELKQDPMTGKWGFTGSPMPLPEVWPMATIPEGGYQPGDIPDPQVRDKIAAFDKAYSSMLDMLQSAWTTGNSGTLGVSVSAMIQMQQAGIDLMQIPLPDGSGENYGPCFRLVR